MAINNTHVYAEEWTVKLQERLDHPTNWEEICNVEITNDRVIHNPYMSTVPSIQSHTRGTAFTYQTHVNTDDSTTINTSRILPMFIDRGDLAQQTFVKQMDLADLQGQLFQELFESQMLADHASWTDVGITGGVITSGDTTQITVSATNVDDIIRGIKRIIRVANGSKLMSRNGVFIVWRPEDFEVLEAFVQANGFSTADMALKDGTVEGMNYMGVEHYVSNEHTANHLFAGVKNTLHLGIVRDLHGQIVVNQSPTDGNGNLSGIGVEMREDYKYKTWVNFKPLLYDLNVT